MKARRHDGRQPLFHRRLTVESRFPVLPYLSPIESVPACSRDIHCFITALIMPDSAALSSTFLAHAFSSAFWSAASRPKNGTKRHRLEDATRRTMAPTPTLRRFFHYICYRHSAAWIASLFTPLFHCSLEIPEQEPQDTLPMPANAEVPSSFDIFLQAEDTPPGRRCRSPAISLIYDADSGAKPRRTFSGSPYTSYRRICQHFDFHCYQRGNAETARQ